MKENRILTRVLSTTLAAIVLSFTCTQAYAVNESDDEHKINASAYEQVIIDEYEKYGIEAEIVEHGKEWISQDELNAALSFTQAAAEGFASTSHPVPTDFDTYNLSTQLNVNESVEALRIMPVPFAYVKTETVSSNVPSGSCEFDIHFDGEIDAQRENIIWISDVEVTPRHSINMESYKINKTLTNKNGRIFSYNISGEVEFKYTEPNTGVVTKNNVPFQFVDFVDLYDYAL